jgi:hypothetical protein
MLSTAEPRRIEAGGTGGAMDDPTSSTAAARRRAAHAILERIFGHVEPGLRYRLWDGSEGDVGQPDGSFTLVLRDPHTFRAVFAGGNTRVMAEAFADNRIDVDGDLFSALRTANQLEGLDLGWLDKVGIWLDARQV